MRIALFVQGAVVSSEKQKHLSGHVQIPLMTANILSDLGHSVTLFTTAAPGQSRKEIPNMISDRIQVEIIPYSSRGWPKEKLRIGSVAKTLSTFWLKARNRFDIVHWFGSDKMGLALGLLARIGLGSIAVFTPICQPSASNRLSSVALKKLIPSINMLIVNSTHMENCWKEINKNIVTAPIGVVKDFSPRQLPDPGALKRILFWRSIHCTQGGPEYLEAVEELSRKYQEYEFTFAVRREGDMRDLDNLSKKRTNIVVHYLPYPQGISIEKILRNTLVAVFPFRALTINPQLSILETLYAGVPVIATDVESNNETIVDGKSGVLIEAHSPEAIRAAIVRMIHNPKNSIEMGKYGANDTRKRWNWDAYKKIIENSYYDAIKRK